MKKPWTTTERRALAAHLAERRTHAEIAAAMDRSLGAIRTAAARLGRPTNRRAWSPHDLFLLRLLREQGDTALQIAAALKRSVQSVRGQLQRRGWPISCAITAPPSPPSCAPAPCGVRCAMRRSDWQAIEWSIGREIRTDYRRTVYGPAGCELRLAAEEWTTRPGWWAARAEIVRDSTARAYMPLWGRGHKMAGYPTPEAAMQAAETWLVEWRAGWAAADDAELLAEIPEGGPLVVTEGGGDAPA